MSARDDLVRRLKATLTAHGVDWPVSTGEFWCRVTPPEPRIPVQGWKLHLSATPLSAPLVLARAAAVLIRHRCPFKFAATADAVQELVSHRYPRGGGGKFITAYPDQTEDGLRALAAELDEATAGLPGPGILSDRPYRPGSLVHYRFGAFTGVPLLGNDGDRQAMLIAPDGTLVPDRREAWFAPPDWAPRDPFARTAVAANPAPAPKPVLLDGRYVVRAAIRHAFGGGVYRATDQDTGTAVIIKQARPHAGASLAGRDVRDLRRHEAAMLARFAPSGRTPRPLGLFEQQGDLFLAQEEIPGGTLHTWVNRNLEFGDRHWGPPAEPVRRIAAALVELVALVHAEGLVLRDFSPNNVMVSDDGRIRLIDLEMLARPGDRVARAYTPGYGAPEQVGAPRLGPAPGPAADRYSLGAVLFYLATGVDPVLPADQPARRDTRQRIRDWLAHLAADNPTATALAPVIVALLDDDPARRPGLDAVRAALSTPAPAPQAAPARRIGSGDLARAITDATGHLVDTMDLQAPHRLWPAKGFAATTDPHSVQHGAAGVLGVLTRAYQVRPDPSLRAAVAGAAGWIAGRLGGEPRTLPGLYFGRSGTAWALLEAGLALGDEELTGLAATLARRIPLRWPNPDVCHGIAGAGLTQLRFWQATGAGEFLDRTRQAADAVVAAAEHRDGLVYWPIPRDFTSGLAGLTHYGFAHGVAGVGAFLLAAGQATATADYHDLAAAAADTLRDAVQMIDGAAYWPSDTTSTAPRTNWCSGSSGVGTFLLRMWRETGDDRLLDLAERAAVAIHRSRWHSGPAQCHGLAGDGEFLLDLAEYTGQPRYRDRAAELAVAIQVRHAIRDGRALAPDETRAEVVADYNTGLSGVLAFLLRLHAGGSRLWLPDFAERR